MAQVSRATFASNLASLVADNSTGQVSEADIRSLLTDLEDSAQWYDEYALKGVVTDATTNYDVLSTDVGKLIIMSSASANTVTFDAGVFGADDWCIILQLGAGTTTITAGISVTIDKLSTDTLALAGQYAMACVVGRGSNLLVAGGALAAA